MISNATTHSTMYSLSVFEFSYFEVEFVDVRPLKLKPCKHSRGANIELWTNALIYVCYVSNAVHLELIRYFSMLAFSASLYRIFTITIQLDHCLNLLNHKKVQRNNLTF